MKKLRSHLPTMTMCPSSVYPAEERPEKDPHAKSAHT